MIVDTIKTSTKFAPFALLLNPWFWLAFIAWSALVGTYGYSLGAEDELAAQQRINAQALDQQAKANAAVLKRERTLRADDREAFDQFKKEHDDAKEDADRTIADLRRDNLRLRVPVRRQVCAGPADGSGSAAAGTGEEGHAELTADASEFLVGLLVRGDSAIRKHAEVVDRYERLRSACMKRDHISNSTVLP